MFYWACPSFFWVVLVLGKQTPSNYPPAKPGALICEPLKAA